jgi:hypothetical protein
MEIVNTPTNIKIKKGRGNKYPFSEIMPGKSLVIQINEYEDIGRITSAFYQYRKNNKLNWEFSTNVVDSKIYINRFK